LILKDIQDVTSDKLSKQIQESIYSREPMLKEVSSQLKQVIDDEDTLKMTSSLFIDILQDS